MSSHHSVRVKTSELPVGSRLGHPINDDEERLLLAAGAPITDKIKQRLLDRGIVYVFLHPDDAAALLGKETKQKTKRTKAKAPKPIKPTASVPRTSRPTPPAIGAAKLKLVKLAATTPTSIENHGAPLSNRVKQRGTEPYNVALQEKLAQNFSATTKLLEAVVQQVMTGKLQDNRPLNVVTRNYVSELAEDTDQSISSSTELAPDPTVTERGMRMAQLAMATAIELGWDEDNVREVGLCGLVHDWGMFQLEERIRDSAGPLSDEDKQELARHPLYTIELLAPLEQISAEVRYAATQVHENPDGSGYPLGISKDEIHAFAHVLHIVDAYITLTAETDDRPAFLPYDVIVYLLNQVKAGRMHDQSMRGFLGVVALFPIGSHVRLSDGTEARVIRRNGQQYTTPVVQRVGADRKLRIDSLHPSIIDLAKTDLRIMSPLVRPERQEERLTEELMDKVLWERI